MWGNYNVKNDLSSFDFNSWLVNGWNGGIGSVGKFLGTPSVNEWCSIITREINFNLSTLKLTSSNRASQSKKLDIYCATEMKYTIRTMGGEGILSNGMMAAFPYLNSLLEGY